jgi:hypothetical protein
MPANLADHAAASAAGYKRQQIDRGGGSGSDPRYISSYEKWMAGNSNVDQATADAQALTVLNAQWASPLRGQGSYGGNLTTDLH